LGPIGSAVLTFIGYKQTDRHQNKQTDRQAKFIYRFAAGHSGWGSAFLIPMSLQP